MPFGASHPKPTASEPIPAFNGSNLRTARRRMRMTQTEFAQRLRLTGQELGEPNGCTKRLVQNWENGEHRRVKPNYQRAITHLTGAPFETLCAPNPTTQSTDQHSEHPYLLPLDPARLRQTRHERGLSQRELAEALFNAGLDLGEPNEASNRLIQLWEGGKVRRPHTKYRRALQRVLGIPFDQLCTQPPASPPT